MPITLDDQVRSLLSVPALAKRTGHSAMCVYRALERLAIQPEVTAPVRLYTPETVVLLIARMRKPRKAAPHVQPGA